MKTAGQVVPPKGVNANLSLSILETGAGTSQPDRETDQ